MIGVPIKKENLTQAYPKETGRKWPFTTPRMLEAMRS